VVSWARNRVLTRASASPASTSEPAIITQTVPIPGSPLSFSAMPPDRGDLQADRRHRRADAQDEGGDDEWREADSLRAIDLTPSGSDSTPAYLSN
jgi:hypothetical protein